MNLHIHAEHIMVNIVNSPQEDKVKDIDMITVEVKYCLIQFLCFFHGKPALNAE